MTITKKLPTVAATLHTTSDFTVNPPYVKPVYTELTQEQIKEHIKYFPLSTEDQFDKYIKKFYSINGDEYNQRIALKIKCLDFRDFPYEPQMYSITNEEIDKILAIHHQIKQVHKFYENFYFDTFKEEILIKMKTPYTLYSNAYDGCILFKDSKNKLYYVNMLERYDNYECFEINDVDLDMSASDFKLYKTTCKSEDIIEYFDNSNFNYKTPITKKGYYFALVKITKNNKIEYHRNIIQFDGKDIKMGNITTHKDNVISWTQLFSKD